MPPRQTTLYRSTAYLTVALRQQRQVEHTEIISQSLPLSYTLIDKRTYTFTDLYEPETALSPSMKTNLCPIRPLTLVEHRVWNSVPSEQRTRRCCKTHRETYPHSETALQPVLSVTTNTSFFFVLSMHILSKKKMKKNPHGLQS